MRKHLLILGLILCGPTPLLPAQEKSLTVPQVAEAILKQDGFSFFTLTVDEPTALRLMMSRNGVDSEIFSIPATKELILAVKRSKDGVISEVHAYTPGRSMSTRSKNGLSQQSYTTSSSSTPIELGQPFLTLRSPTDKLTLTVVVAK